MMRKSSVILKLCAALGSPVPSQLMSIASPRGLISRDSCLQPAARNSLGTTGHVFQDLPAPDESSSALF